MKYPEIQYIKGRGAQINTANPFHNLQYDKNPIDWEQLGEDDDKITKKVEKGKYDITEGPWSTISVEAKTLIKKMLDVDYSRRISAKDALADNWFKQAKDTVVDVDVMRESLRNLTRFRATQKL